MCSILFRQSSCAHTTMDDVYVKQAQQLLEMGYSPEQVQTVLDRTGGDLSRATLALVEPTVTIGGASGEVLPEIPRPSSPVIPAEASAAAANAATAAAATADIVARQQAATSSHEDAIKALKDMTDKPYEVCRSMYADYGNNFDLALQALI